MVGQSGRWLVRCVQSQFNKTDIEYLKNKKMTDKQSNLKKKWMGASIIIIAVILVFIANSDYFIKAIKVTLNFCGIFLGSIGGSIIGRANKK